MRIAEVKDLIRNIPDFPKAGINFKDITPILKDREAFRTVVKKLAKRFKHKQVDVVASAESRGFIFGAALAYELKAGFVPLRKPGKLPFKTLKEEYKLEYGSDVFEIHVDGIKKGDGVLIVDDVLATGGTMQASVNLIKKLGGDIAGIALLIALTDLDAIKKISEYDAYALFKLKG